jgi:hypothetical protein
MKVKWSALLAQPWVALATMLLAVGALAASWLSPITQVTRPPSLTDALLAAVLIVTLVLTQRFPIHVRQNSKIHLGSVPLYLMATLLPPPVAVSATLLGMLGGEVMMRRQRGGYWSDIATQVGRWTLGGFFATLLAHRPEYNLAGHSGALIAAGLILWLGDVLTSPLLLTPLTGESPWTVIVDVARQAAPLEGAQYLVGLLGAAAAEQHAWTLFILPLPTIMVYLTAKRAKELQDGTREILESMADAVDLRDPYTGGHSRRVTQLTAATLREMGLSGPDVELVVSAARVHDLGKIGMPDTVLLKEGALNEEEWAIMKAHPQRGAELLERYPDFSRGADIVRYHHERWDGQGYPHGLRGNAIPFGARVIAVADSYDAMTSDRPYRQGMSPQRAASILREGRNRQWDPTIVDAFLPSIAGLLEVPSAPSPDIGARPSLTPVSAASV